MTRTKGEKAGKHVREALTNCYKNQARISRLSTAVTAKTDEQLIEEAIGRGKVQELPDGYAMGIRGAAIKGKDVRGPR